jgi:TolB-like protein
MAEGFEVGGRVTPVPLLQITLLNGFHVATASGQTVEIAAKKTRALLAYLALPAGRQHTRDKLADLLWSDRGDKQARASLRQALGELRKSFDALEDSPLAFDHDTVALDSALVEVDVARLESLAAGENLDDLRRAAPIYAGDLFHGFDVSDPSYADWLRGERERLRGIAMHVLNRLLERETGPAAISAGRRLLELDPLGEDAHRALMRCYAAAGEIGAALKQYERCRDVLQRDLAAKPSPETEALHRTIRDHPSTLGAPRAGQSTNSTRQEIPETAPAAKPSVAVLPFANLSGDPGQQQFSDGITSDLIADLSRFSSLLVKGGRGTAVDARQASQELGVRYVLEGSVQRDGGRLRINAQLIDAVTNAHLWAKRFDREATGLFAIQDEVVEAIVAELAVKLDLVERDRAKRKTTENLSAYELWLRARDHISRSTWDDNATARRLLERAVELDPHDPRYAADLALAHHHESRWGWSDSQSRSLETAEELARKGVRLDDADYRTHWVLATVLHAKSDFGGAAAAYERAYALNPNDADLLADFGGFHNYRGQPDEAIRRIENAIRLNPFYPDWYLRLLAFAYFCIGNHTKAIEIVHRARQPHAGLLRVLVAAHLMLGQREQAEAAGAEMIKLEPRFTISALRKGLPFKDPALGEPYFAALRKAGLPE